MQLPMVFTRSIPKLGNLLRAAQASANYMQGEKSGLRAAEGDNLLASTKLVAACDFLAVGDCSGEEWGQCALLVRGSGVKLPPDVELHGRILRRSVLRAAPQDVLKRVWCFWQPW